MISILPYLHQYLVAFHPFHPYPLGFVIMQSS
jgi:hypothetical protein